MKIFFLLIGVGFLSISLQSQTTIYGKVTDEETGEELIGANIVLTKNDVFITGAATDFDGNYSVELDTGLYRLSVTYTGYPERVITNIPATKDLKLDVQLNGRIELICLPIYSGYIPLIEQDHTTSGHSTYSNQIRNLPTKDINEISSFNTAGVSIDRH